MYLNFFHLKEPPFNITPDPKFLYYSPRHREAVDHLLYGIVERKGFIELIGEVGCGKTTLCRAVLSQLPDTVKTAFILNPALTGTQLLRAILCDLGQKPTARDRLSLIEQLNEFLLEQFAEGFNIAVLIDESQNLLPEVMEQIRLLSNLETDQHKLMQIVIAGQPELKKRLAGPELRQLRQRITVHCELLPLSEEETSTYVAHRLKVAGAAEGVGFDAEAIRAVYEYSQGIPRLVNALCDRALLAGYVAGTQVIHRPQVQQAVAEIGEYR